MKHIVLITFLISSFCVQAQYYKAEILMTNGNTKQGFAKLPSNKSLDANIEFKSTKKGSVQKLKHDLISKIIYTSNSDDQFLFERNDVVHLYKSFGKERKKKKVNKHWMLLIHRNASVQEYSLSQRYRLDKKGRMLSITDGNSFWSTIYFLLRKPQEDKAYIVNGKGFTHGMVRKAMAIYFKDLPEFVERINNKEFKKSNVSDVADAYDAYFN